MKLIMEKFGDVHIFSSFFYPKLLCGGYETVCCWHMKIDIFGKSFPFTLMQIHTGVWLQQMLLTSKLYILIR